MLTPIGKRILVKPVEETHGNLIVSGQKPTRFIVIANGDEVTKVNVNDIIYLDKYSGAGIEHEKEQYLVIDESSILAKVSP